MWLIKYQWMDDSNYVAFEDFYKPQRQTIKTKKRSKEELLNLAKEVQGKINAGNYTKVKI
jgi:hypothetical protein